MSRIYFFIIAGLTCFIWLHAQPMILPMEIPPYLSGNFGELRSNHFHSGIDFKTQGKTGIPVCSVKDGYLSRIYVSPRGYGRAAYIAHPDGTTTVYGHLDRFSNRIESAVRDSQYYQESFAVDLFFREELFPVKQRDIIGYSGNAGSSGGPHLHFEIRETNSEKIIDPLPFYLDKIKDTRPPEIRDLMLFPQTGQGVVNGSVDNQVIQLIKNKSGKQTLAKPIKAWGNVGVGVKAYDRMNGTTNAYGVKEVILKFEGVEVFHSSLDCLSFGESRYLNSFIDWNDWIEHRSSHMKSFIEPGNRLDSYHTPTNGIFFIDKEQIYSLEYTLIDAHGNLTVFPFKIIGEKQSLPPYRPTGTFWAFNRDHAFSDRGIELKIPRGNLYKDYYADVDITGSYTPFSPLYSFKERIPLHNWCSISLKITSDSYPDRRKYGVVSVDQDKKNWLGGRYENGKMQVDIRELGHFAIMIDTVSPVITPVNLADWTRTGRMEFKVADRLSGVDRWKGTLNDRFVLFEYDPKKSALFCIFDPLRMKRGEQLLELTVTDACENRSDYKKKVIL